MVTVGGLLAFATVSAQQQPLISYVRPLVGTSGYGNTYPGAQIPFGGIQISPDTDADYYDAAAGYKYDHKTLLGFSLTHLSGTGIRIFMRPRCEMNLSGPGHEQKIAQIGDTGSA